MATVEQDNFAYLLECLLSHYPPKVSKQGYILFQHPKMKEFLRSRCGAQGHKLPELELLELWLDAVGYYGKNDFYITYLRLEEDRMSLAKILQRKKEKRKTVQHQVVKDHSEHDSSIWATLYSLWKSWFTS